ncbi:MAG: prepilin peptidase [Eubacteriales bacterium]|nr:prepilin peptidase [Eubacteriales bacterium]
MENLAVMIYFTVLSSVLGAAFGSFMNCMAWRMVHGESVFRGRSHCTSCGHTLGAVDLVPIVSYLACKGACRYCGEKISPRYLLAEVLPALGFAGFFLSYGFSVLTLRAMVLLCILLGASMVDISIYEIPDGFVLAGILWWAVTLPFLGGSVMENLKEGLCGGLLIGGVVLLTALCMDWLLKKETMGGGDIKLLFMVGLYVGVWQGLLLLFLSCLLGLALSFGTRQNRIPFGPAIGAAACLVLIIGEPVTRWYFSLIAF